MKLEEAFAKRTYRERTSEPHYSVARFKDGEFAGFVYDEYDRVQMHAESKGAEQWMQQRGYAAEDLPENIEWRVIVVDIVPRK